MKRPTGLKILTALHLILSIGFLWFFIFLLPMVYDSNMSIKYEKIMVSINLIMNLICFFGFIRKSKIGWYASTLYFVLVILNSIITTILTFITTFTIPAMNLIIAISSVLILFYLLEDSSKNYFGVEHKFPIKMPEYKVVKQFVTSPKVIIIIILLFHSIILVFNVLKFFYRSGDVFGYMFGYKQIPEIPDIIDKFQFLLTPWIVVIFILSNFGAILGILLKKIWGLFLSLICFTYFWLKFTNINMIILKLGAGSSILDVIPNLFKSIIGVAVLVLFIYFLSKKPTIGYFEINNKIRKAFIVFAILIALAFVSIDYIRLLPLFL